MPTDIDRLRQLRVASYTGRLPPDLALWAVEIIEDTLPHFMRVRRRNELLQAAADLLPATTSVRSKAAAISDGLVSMKRAGHSSAEFVENTFEWLLASAIEYDWKTPTSWRHIARLIDA